MLTSYFVKCPRSGCPWIGSIIPSHDEQAAGPIVVFECPQCREHWRAEVVGEDVRPVGLRGEAAGVSQPVGW